MPPKAPAVASARAACTRAAGPAKLEKAQRCRAGGVCGPCAHLCVSTWRQGRPLLELRSPAAKAPPEAHLPHDPAAEPVAKAPEAHLRHNPAAEPVAKAPPEAPRGEAPRGSAPETPREASGGTGEHLALDPAVHEVRCGGTALTLTPREFGLLEFLTRQASEVVSKTAILEAAWHPHYEGDVNIVEVYVGYLRRKTGRRARQHRNPARSRLPRAGWLTRPLRGAARRTGR
jgi:hypothetical protein